MIHQVILMMENNRGDNDSGNPDDGEQPGDNDSSAIQMTESNQEIMIQENRMTENNRRQ